MTESNPYVSHLMQKGYSAAECRTPAPRRTFSCTIGMRTFETEEQYQKALADTSELEEFLYDKCRQDPDLLATIICEYVWNLTPIKRTELEDLLANNFGDD